MGKVRRANSSATSSNAPPKKAQPAGVDSVKKSIEIVMQRVDSSDQVVAVDTHVPGASGYEVAKGSDGESMSIYLNCSDLKKNNNKFYILQVLQRVGQTGESHMAMLWSRYGRVGDDGVKTQKHLNYSVACKDYDKTSRAKQRKGYTEIKMAAQSQSCSQETRV